jgi:leucyl aminopeptidase
MNITISSSNDVSKASNLVLLINEKTDWKQIENIVTPSLAKTIQQKVAQKVNPFVLNSGTEILLVVNIENGKQLWQQKETARKFGFQINKSLNAQKAEAVSIFNATNENALAFAFIEGLALSNYQFTKYLTKDNEPKSLTKILVDKSALTKSEIEELNILIEAVFKARTLINEPVNFLTAKQLGEEFKIMAKEAGIKVEVFDKKKIETLKMGGLLAVNSGSQDPPSFSILEYKPAKAKNKQPIVLVGKGVVYDTGGLSLKPTPNSMDQMKSDMSGAACVAATIFAAAKAKLPLYIVALAPATDNRPGEKAYTPGDVIRMMDGSTVEVLNTDAEGRMILADALHYAKKYKPELVIDVATLTGAAMRALGSHASAYMGTADKLTKEKIEKSGFETFEKLWEFPLWEEYGKMLHSDIADQKNIGGELAGMITAGKFLEKFTNYPWLHLDIAGPAFTLSESEYRGKGGTAIGVRLLFDFLKNY